jgi:hypothetical protein
MLKNVISTMVQTGLNETKTNLTDEKAERSDVRFREKSEVVTMASKICLLCK